MSNMVMTSVKTDRGIRYAVMVSGKEIWQREVRFGHAKSNRAGGSAFIDAAREQERVAYKAYRDQRLEDRAP